MIERLSADGDLEAAVEQLDDAFTSPCEHTDPDAVATGPSHEIACLLYDDSGGTVTESSDAVADD